MPQVHLQREKLEWKRHQYDRKRLLILMVKSMLALDFPPWLVLFILLLCHDCDASETSSRAPTELNFLLDLVLGATLDNLFQLNWRITDQAGPSLSCFEPREAYPSAAPSKAQSFYHSRLLVDELFTFCNRNTRTKNSAHFYLVHCKRQAMLQVA